MKIAGDIKSISDYNIRQLEKLYDFRTPRKQVIGREMAEELARLTRMINREIAVYITRRGETVLVAVGTSVQVKLPLAWHRRSRHGLSGVRCVHSHPGGNPTLSAADISSLKKFRFDAMSAVGVPARGSTLYYSVSFNQPADGRIGAEAEVIHHLTEEAFYGIDIEEKIREIEAASETVLSESRTAAESAVIAVIDWYDSDDDFDEKKSEIRKLAETAGLEVIETAVFHQIKPVPATMMGKGNVTRLADTVQRLNPDCVIIDDSLSASQQRNLTDIFGGVKVLDRTAVILDIFAQRARTREGKIQVELAQLQYLLPRLMGKGQYLSRLGGGIGTRGPGETKLETDRRHIRRRIQHLNKELAGIKKQRQTMYQSKKRKELPQVTLVGYTNAGKSSLLNALAESDVTAEDKLFATLDPTTRKISLREKHQEIMLTDTVGFIRHLPHQLVNAFKSTLEEVRNADLLLHVVDVSNYEWKEQAETVNRVLHELGADEKPVIHVFNKIDKRFEKNILVREYEPVVFTSAYTGEGLYALVSAIANFFFPYERFHLLVPHERGDLLSLAHNLGRVETVGYTAEGAEIYMFADPGRLPESLRNCIVEEKKT